MGEAKRRKKLGLPPREKPIELPKLDKKSIQKKVKSMIYKYPIIPFIFYITAIGSLLWGIFNIMKIYKLV